MTARTAATITPIQIIFKLFFIFHLQTILTGCLYFFKTKKIWNFQYDSAVSFNPGSSCSDNKKICKSFVLGK